jgi:hypothetical protein
MSLTPGEHLPASLTYRRRRDVLDEDQDQRQHCQCQYLVLLSLDETIEGVLIGRMMCPDCGRHWTRTGAQSPAVGTPPSLRSEATPMVWKQRQGSD